MKKFNKVVLIIICFIMLLFGSKIYAVENNDTIESQEKIIIEEKKDISKAKVSNISDSYYTGTRITPNIIIEFDGEELKKDVDYEIEYSNNINVGNAKAEIKGIGKYEGTINRNFSIIETPISMLSIFDIENQVYTGEKIKPDVIIKNGEQKLVLNRDYTLNYKDNKDFGTAIVTIELKGNYVGRATKAFNIVPKKVTGVKVDKVTNNSISIKWNKVSNATGYRIYIYNNDKQQFEYYGKTKANSITINKLAAGIDKVVRIRAYKNVKGKNYFGEYCNEFHIGTSPKKVKGIEVTERKTSELTISWNKVRGATGYRLYIYNNSKKAYTYYGASSTNSITVKSLNSATNYTMKIRPYKTIDGTKYFGEYTIFSGVTAPRKVKGVNIKDANSNSITLKWDRVSNVKDYRVYIYNYSKNKYEYYGATNTNSITIKKLAPSTEYKIRIRAFKKVNGKYYFGEYSTPIIAVTQIDKISNLKMVSLNSDNVKIKWNKVKNADGYKVYIDKNNKGNFVYYGRTSTNSITVSSLDERTNYGIRVRAFKYADDKYHFGKYSSVLQFKTPIELSISNTEYENAYRQVYGTSGQGRELVYYRLGNKDANNVMILNFAIHGYEDAFRQDGYELVLVAHKLIKYLSDNINIVNNNNWCIYIIPSSNPDGLIYAGGAKTGNCNGIGRKTYYILNSNGRLTKGGIDLNRSFPYNKAGGFKKHIDERNYTGSNPMMAKEAVALNDFILDTNKKNVSGNKIFMDIHGWTNQIITTNGGKLYTYLNNQFRYNYHTELDSSRAYGYVSNWALKNGYDSCLFEFPSNVTKEGDVSRKGYDTKFINAIKNIINEY